MASLLGSYHTQLSSSSQPCPGGGHQLLPLPLVPSDPGKRPPWGEGRGSRCWWEDRALQEAPPPPIGQEVG